MQYVYEKESDLVKEGDYEVTIESMEVKTLNSGKNKVQVMCRIRSDVEQAFKNRVLFDDIWEEREAPGYFNRKRMSKILGVCGATPKQEFDGLKSVIEFCEGKYVKIHVGVVFNSYSGEEENTISYYMKTQFGTKTLGGETEEQHKDDKVAVVKNDDDLPF